MAGQGWASEQLSGTRIVELLLVIGMTFMVLAIVNIAISNNGLGLVDSGPLYGQPVSVRGDLEIPLETGGLLAWKDGDQGQGTIDAATGLRPAEFAGPFTAGVSWPNASGWQRLGWSVREASGAALALAGTFLVLGLVRSTRLGDPFNAANVKRLRQLAAVVAVGWTAQALLSQYIDILILRNSAATDVFEKSLSISFVPLIAGAVLAVLAQVWNTGVELRSEVEGMV